MALFPVTCQVVDHGPAFTGLRHFLFVVPLFAVLAGIRSVWRARSFEDEASSRLEWGRVGSKPSSSHEL
jgi:hypothetical protein